MAEPQPRQRLFVYLIGEDKDTGKRLFDGPVVTGNGLEADKAEANRKGFSVFEGEFEMYILNTRDPNSAKSKLRSKLLDDGQHTISDVMKPMYGA